MGAQRIRAWLPVALVAFALPALAQKVDPRIHKLCLEAKDYAGCVRAMTGESLVPAPAPAPQPADAAAGNQCPAGFAYVGGGNCQKVYCQYPATDSGHDPIVAGKPGWGCKASFWRGAGELRLGAVAKAYVNPNCPPGEPPMGYNSTCDLGKAPAPRGEGAESTRPSRLTDR